MAGQVSDLPAGAGAEIALSRQAHDRIADRRVDRAWFDEAWASAKTRVLVVSGTRIKPVRGRMQWLTPEQAPQGTPVLLGERDAVIHFAMVADASLAASEEGWVPLRAAMGIIAEDEAALVVHAVAIAEWLWATRHCIRCGGLLRVEQLGHLLRCQDCGREHFPRTDAAVIMMVVDGQPPEDRCLLGRNSAWPPGRYSTLAGFVEPGESMEQAVRREVMEETGVHIGAVRYFGSQPWPLPRSLMVGFVAEATSTEVSVDGNEIADARWFTREQIRAEAEAGTLLLPSGISISRSLVESWYGAALPGHW